MNEEAESQSATASPFASPFLRQAAIAAILLLVGFLLGFVPMWLSAREAGARLAVVERELFVTGMNHTLASAAIAARRGHYEPARQAASRFYSSLQAEVDRGPLSVLTQAQRQGVQPVLALRDEVITLLARSDPAAADRLSDSYAEYRRVMNG